jgi:hypothetical protein
MDPYHYVDIVDNIRKRREAFDAELDSNTDRADVLLLTNNVDASIKDIYEFLKKDPKARRQFRKDILKELNKEGYLNDNLREDVRLFLEIRDLYAHNLIIDDVHEESEKLLAQTRFVKHRIKNDKYWKAKKIREKIVRVYNELMPELLNQWNSIVIDEASK